MPKLCIDMAAGLVDSIGYRSPGLDLSFTPKTRDISVSYAEGIDRYAFGDDEACTRSLRIIIGHDGSGEIVHSSAQARERSHKYAVRQMKIANLDRIEESIVVLHVRFSLPTESIEIKLSAAP
jgi:hypothetical protein